MSGVALNFFPLAKDQFTITLYRFPFVDGERPITCNEEAVRRSLEVDGHRDFYWTLFQRTKDGTKVVCQPFDNVYVTIDALRLALIENCRNNLSSDSFQITEGFHRRVEIVIDKYPEGSQVISLDPYLLRSHCQFGFLADFRFHPNEEHRGTKRSLQLSLSLDKHGQQNLNYYADRYSHLVSYVTKFHDQLFPLHIPGGKKVEVQSRIVELKHETLGLKNYVFGSGESRSQFMGVKQYGPLEQIPEDTHLYFLYRREDHSLSQDLFKALRGDTFRTFPGMEDMFHLPFSKQNVSGVVLSDFSNGEIHRIRDRVLTDAAGRKVLPIVLTPFSRHDVPDDNKAYWHLKHAFLSKGLPIQVVSTETVADKNKLKWSSAGIGLQVFAKIGGTPWKVRPQTEKCLIVGIGQAHHRVSEKHIDRYFAYSVLTDSSGVFEEIRILGQSQNEDHYIENFSANLRKIFEDYSCQFSSFVVHSTFKIRRRELESIAEALAERQEKVKTGEFISLKFNDRNRFFGFAVGHNSRVPYESTVLRLSGNEFLIWFEGLQYGQPTLRKRVGSPLHIQFTYPHEGLSWQKQQVHLQDAINLSGANWRGFNAKSLPVSIYYAQLIAKYLKEFESHGLPKVNVDTLTPWFL